ncbi:MAG: hypothetical protein GWN67_19815 [Phycisphaerae bacterium]|nr:hypothetical protein [Phycisphaerae bacterium]NIU58542.1 hypothetical protein [Phycisphaerae bacterium]
MPNTAVHILKSDEVKLEGQFRLDLAQVQSHTGGPKGQSPALKAPQVRIVENHPEFADIEITCSCGIKTHLKCEYAGTQVPEESITQNGQADTPDLKTDNNKINGEKQNEE